MCNTLCTHIERKFNKLLVLEVKVNFYFLFLQIITHDQDNLHTLTTQL